MLGDDTASRLLASAEAERARQVFLRVFVSRRPHGVVLDESMTPGGFLYPVSYDLDSATLGGIVAAASQCFCEGKGYLTDTEVDEAVARCWEVPLGLKAYLDLRDLGFAPAENAIYSASGQWGVMVASELFGVIGGTSGFVAALAKSLDVKYEDEALRFLREYPPLAREGGANLAWVPPLLCNVFGAESGRRLLKAAGFVNPRKSFVLGGRTE